MVIIMKNELLLVIFRSILILIILFGLTKIMGKKQISQMNIYDYLIGITIGNLAADISLNLSHDLINGILSLIIYALSSVLVTYLSLKNLKLRKLFSGTPTILIEKGDILIKNLKKEGIDINNLTEEARLNGYFNLSDIEYAILETNGQISFLPKSINDYVTNKNMKLKTKENELSINLIQDGVIMKNNLDYINKTEEWLKKKIKDKGYKRAEEIFLFIYKNEREITIYDYKKKTH